MIDELFTFTKCDETDQLVIVYENVKLVSSVGIHPPDTSFLYATIDYQKGFLILGCNSQEWQYPLHFTIGQLLTKEPTQ